jgi:hypothetical protein
LAVLAVVLAFIQQVRITQQNQKSEQTANEREQRLVGEGKYTQGQLDSINKVLTAVVTNESTGSQQNAILGGLLAAVGAANAKPSQSSDPTVLSNSQLREEALAIARRMREFNEESSADPKDGSPKGTVL